MFGLAGTVVQGTWSAIEYLSRTFVGTLCSRSSFMLSTPHSSVLDRVIRRPYPRFHLVVNRVLVRCLQCLLWSPWCTTYWLLARGATPTRLSSPGFVPVELKQAFFWATLNLQTVRKSISLWKYLGAYNCYTGHWKCSCPQSCGLDAFQRRLWICTCTSASCSTNIVRGTKCLWGPGKGLHRLHDCKQWRHGCLPILFQCTVAVQAHHLSRLSSMTSLTFNSGLCLCQETLWCWWHTGQCAWIVE